MHVPMQKDIGKHYEAIIRVNSQSGKAGAISVLDASTRERKQSGTISHCICACPHISTHFYTFPLPHLNVKVTVFAHQLVTVTISAWQGGIAYILEQEYGIALPKD